MPPGFEPPTSRPDTSWLEGRQALTFTVLLLGGFGLLFLGLVVADAAGPGRVQLSDVAFAVAFLASAWVVLWYRRRTR